MLRFLALLCCLSAFALEPIPDKLVVLTFDDSKASHFAFVRLLLKENGFGATFFITEGFTFASDKTNYLTWDQIAQLHREGFEIGNHTRDHMGVTKSNLPRLKEQVDVVNQHLAEHGIPKAVSFSWPGNAITPEAFPILRDLGIKFARRGGAPEYAYEEGRGFAYEPGADNPLFIPSAGDSRPAWTFEDFKRAVDQAKNGRIAVMQFHGVPDVDHPWVRTDPDLFRQYINYLRDEKFHVIAMRDLARYVDPAKWPADPMAVIEARKKSLEAK